MCLSLIIEMVIENYLQHWILSVFQWKSIYNAGNVIIEGDYNFGFR